MPGRAVVAIVVVVTILAFGSVVQEYHPAASPQKVTSLNLPDCDISETGRTLNRQSVFKQAPYIVGRNCSQGDYKQKGCLNREVEGC